MNFEFVFPILTRVLIFILAIFADFLIEDHEATDVENFAFKYSNSVNKIFLSPFSKWDAVHYLKIASLTYTKEKQYVFFPLYPFIMKKFCGVIVSKFLNEQEQMIICGILLNILAFIITYNIFMFLMEKLYIKNEIIHFAKICFCINPAGIFFLTIYTESIYSMLCWFGLYLYESNSYDCLLAIVSLFLASCVRSNGNLNAIFVIIKISQLLLKQFIYQNHSIKNFLVIISYHVVVLIATITPFFVWNTYTTNFLSELEESNKPKNNFFFNAYSYLQNKYWGVGFLKYYQLKQIPNFLLALPIIIISIYTIYFYFFQDSFSNKSEIYSNKKTVLTTILNNCQSKSETETNKETLIFLNKIYFQERGIKILKKNKFIYFLLNSKVLPHIIHLLCVLFVGLFFANVQITTRLICSSCPIIYIGMGNIFLNDSKYKNYYDFLNLINIKVKKLKKRRNEKLFHYSEILFFYLIFFNIVGIFLHCNYYPWT
jgi:phosphatidylinositol glycan class V